MEIYEMRITYSLDPDTGEPLVGLHEDGELDITTKLGMLRLTEDTLLHAPDDDEDDND